MQHIKTQCHGRQQLPARPSDLDWYIDLHDAPLSEVLPLRARRGVDPQKKPLGRLANLEVGWICDVWMISTTHSSSFRWNHSDDIKCCAEMSWNDLKHFWFLGSACNITGDAGLALSGFSAVELTLYAFRSELLTPRAPSPGWQREPPHSCEPTDMLLVNIVAVARWSTVRKTWESPMASPKSKSLALAQKELGCCRLAPPAFLPMSSNWIICFLMFSWLKTDGKMATCALTAVMMVDLVIQWKWDLDALGIGYLIANLWQTYG